MKEREEASERERKEGKGRVLGEPMRASERGEREREEK